jgi:hypothetical protein
MKTWHSDPVTEAQLRFLEKLGSAIKPKTKGEASELIDRLLGGKNHKSRNPTLKLHSIKDVNQIVDDAAERVKRELDNANKTSRCHGSEANQKATPKPPMLRLFGSDAPDEENGRSDDCRHPGQHRGAEDVGSGEMAGEPDQAKTHRSSDEIDRKSRSPEHSYNH